MAARYDTIIIGAGMSGLAAGIRLAQFDQRVVVLERHSLWGGLNSFYKLGGRRFDVGLHALTNYAEPGQRGLPLTRVLRQLRIPLEALRLAPQRYSVTRLADTELRFTNDLTVLRDEVAAHFPSQADGFDRLSADLHSYPPVVGDETSDLSTRKMLGGYLHDRRLVDLLLLPLLYYGSPTPHDMDWFSFRVLYKSIYEEGFGRPAGGVRTILDVLRRRYGELDGELRMRSGVERILQDQGRVCGVRLTDGTELEADRLLSSAGWVETMRLCGGALKKEYGQASGAGQLTFVESISVLDTYPADLGHDAAITFFCTTDEFTYARPDSPVDYTSGVVCCPDNYLASERAPEGTLRLTLLANYDRWASLPEPEYVALKEEVWERGHGVIAGFAPDIRPHTVFKDVFTPRTIEHFTGHVNGAVYGSPRKRRSGETPLPGLFLCGTDQGLLGIVGTLLSGISMANMHALVNV